MLGKGYQKTEKSDQAIKAFKKSVTLKKKNYNAQFAMGQIYLSQQKFQSAAGAFNKALKANPKKHRAAYNYAVAVESNDPENYVKNISAWERFIKIAKKNPRARKEMASAEGHLKELKEAKRQADLQ